MKCKNCGIDIKHKNLYCSNQCQKEYQYNEYINNWKNR